MCTCNFKTASYYDKNVLVTLSNRSILSHFSGSAIGWGFRWRPMKMQTFVIFQALLTPAPTLLKCDSFVDWMIMKTTIQRRPEILWCYMLITCPASLSSIALTFAKLSFWTVLAYSWGGYVFYAGADVVKAALLFHTGIRPCTASFPHRGKYKFVLPQVAVSVVAPRWQCSVFCG